MRSLAAALAATALVASTAAQAQDKCLSTREAEALVRRAVEKCLTEQERQVIRLRYGLEGEEPLRQRQVAERTGISRSYVSRIEKRALEKLRAELEA